MSYTQAFESAVDHLMLYEVGGFWDINAPGAQDGTDARACGYVNDPHDAGGETKYGIAKNDNPTVDITNLDWVGAQTIYFQAYWVRGKCDQMPGRIGALHFDACVNNGVSGAAKFLEAAVGVAVDGSVGPGTLAAVNAQDPVTVCNADCDQRVAHYNAIVVNDPSQARYLAGWLRRVSEMRAFVTDPNNQF